MIEVSIDGQGWVTLVCSKYRLVLSRNEFITALRRAKAWKRHRTLEQRLANAARGRDAASATQA
jgi:hypothetical protein